MYYCLPAVPVSEVCDLQRDFDPVSASQRVERVEIPAWSSIPSNKIIDADRDSSLNSQTMVHSPCNIGPVACRRAIEELSTMGQWGLAY